MAIYGITRDNRIVGVNVRNHAVVVECPKKQIEIVEILNKNDVSLHHVRDVIDDYLKEN